MKTLDDLIDKLRADGELDSTGEFTLDREQAREKMRHFQLADPRAYVLELVQAAVLAGATEAHFQIDADDMILEFDGTAFTADQLEQLYSAMFARGDSSSAAALGQLAIGLNAAMALDPRHVHVKSGTARMTMRPGVDEDVTTAGESVKGTRIHVRDRFHGRTLVRFFGKLRGDLAEATYLEERCRHVTMPIYLGERCISGLPILPDTVARLELTRPSKRGPVRVIAGFLGPMIRPAEMWIFKEGVEIATHPLDDFPPDFVAHVESGELRRDVSRSAIVRDEGYGRVLKVVRDAFLQTLERLADKARRGPSRKVDELYRRSLFHPITQPLMRSTGSDRLSGRARKMASVPLWKTVRAQPSTARWSTWRPCRTSWRSRGTKQVRWMPKRLPRHTLR